jgi:hypothetical protein
MSTSAKKEGAKNEISITLPSYKMNVIGKVAILQQK